MFDCFFEFIENHGLIITISITIITLVAPSIYMFKTMYPQEQKLINEQERIKSNAIIFIIITIFSFILLFALTIQRFKNIGYSNDRLLIMSTILFILIILFVISLLITANISQKNNYIELVQKYNYDKVISNNKKNENLNNLVILNKISDSVITVASENDYLNKLVNKKFDMKISSITSNDLKGYYLIDKKNTSKNNFKSMSFFLSSSFLLFIISFLLAYTYMLSSKYSELSKNMYNDGFYIPKNTTVYKNNIKCKIKEGKFIEYRHNVNNPKIKFIDKDNNTWIVKLE